MQKWYMSIVAELLRAETCYSLDLYGFEPGRQPMEISELLRLLLQKCNEWDIPLLI